MKIAINSYNEVVYEIRTVINKYKLNIIGYYKSIQVIIIVVRSFVAARLSVHTGFGVNERIRASYFHTASWRLRLAVLLHVVSFFELQSGRRGGNTGRSGSSLSEEFTRRQNVGKCAFRTLGMARCNYSGGNIRGGGETVRSRFSCAIIS